MTPETKTKQLVKADLKNREQELHPSFWWTSLSDRFQSGLPDFLFVQEGVVGFIEAKADSPRLRPLQLYVAEQMLAAGAEYWVVFKKNKKLTYQKWDLKTVRLLRKRVKDHDERKTDHTLERVEGGTGVVPADGEPV